MVVLETVANALGDDSTGGHNAKLEAELATGESDAVPSTLPPEQAWIGRLLCSRDVDGGPSVVHRGLQILVATHAVVLAATFAEIEAARVGIVPNDLHYVASALGGLALSMNLPVLESARVGLGPGGALERLGVGGERKISVADSTRLARWRNLLCGASALSVLTGVLFLGMAIVNAGPSVLVPSSGLDWQGRLYFALIAANAVATIPIVLSGWWASMLTASTLCRYSVAEVRPPQQTRQVSWR